MRRPALALILLLSLVPPALAMVGGAREIPDPKSQPEVMFVGSRGTFCTGVMVAPDLVLTAAHCVQAGADYKLVELDAEKKPIVKDTLALARHPQFNLKTLLAHRATADIALLKLAEPRAIAPAILLPPRPRVAVGERFVVRGYGTAIQNDHEAKTAATLRTATLAATGQPGNLQLRLFDPRTAGVREGLGACTGDSGAPVYQEIAGARAVYGVVSWSTGPNGEGGCGGLTGVTPLDLYRGWLNDAARKLGSPIGP
jgi:secreted trypsin-like serine protease